MALNKYQTEWIVSHLLFPNSAQARDIFLYLVSDSKTPTLQNEKSKIYFFKSVCALYFKTTRTQSGRSFSDFKSGTINSWSIFFEKLDKEEVLILVGVFYLELTYQQIAEVFRRSEKQMLNKINKTVYKLMARPSAPLQVKIDFKFKKYDSDLTSNFFIFDDVVLSVLQNSDIKILLNKPSINQLAVKKYYVEVYNFKNELIQLNHLSYDYPEIKNTSTDQVFSQVLPKNQKIRWFGVSAIIVSCLILFVSKPHFIHYKLIGQKSEIIEIQSLRIDRHIEDKNDDTDKNKKILNSDSKLLVENSTKISTDQKVVSAVLTTKPVALSVAKIGEDQKPAAVEKIKPAGGLFRGLLSVTDVQQVVGVVKEKIISLGGKKAGEVELGWMKNDDTSYFHFSLPETHKTEFQDYLKQFGTAELVYEPHPRTMPKGLKRYIIEIKQNE